MRYIAVKGCTGCPKYRNGDSAVYCIALDACHPRKLGSTLKAIAGHDIPWWDGIVPGWCPLPELPEGATTP